MSIIVYFLDINRTPRCKEYTDLQMTEALGQCQDLRQQGYTHVTMVTQLDGQVGGMGVSAVVDGKLPNGDTYEWSKAHRAGSKPPK